jgi:hypothetical protein
MGEEREFKIKIQKFCYKHIFIFKVTCGFLKEKNCAVKSKKAESLNQMPAT